MKKLFNRETVLYVVFGAATTVINYIVFLLYLRFFGTESTLVANIVAFIVAVSFAFVTNKLWVFESKSWSKAVIRKELPSFLGARLFSLGLEELGLWICLKAGVDELSLCGINGIKLAKLALAVIVIFLNYVFSKFYIFKKE